MGICSFPCCETEGMGYWQEGCGLKCHVPHILLRRLAVSRLSQLRLSSLPAGKLPVLSGQSLSLPIRVLHLLEATLSAENILRILSHEVCFFSCLFIKSLISVWTYYCFIICCSNCSNLSQRAPLPWLLYTFHITSSQLFSLQLFFLSSFLLPETARCSQLSLYVSCIFAWDNDLGICLLCRYNYKQHSPQPLLTGSGILIWLINYMIIFFRECKTLSSSLDLKAGVSAWIMGQLHMWALEKKEYLGRATVLCSRCCGQRGMWAQ